MSGLSDYEKLRLDNIERNRQFLAQIGLEPNKMGSSSSSSSSPKKRRKAESLSLPPDEFLRRSSRVAQLGNVSYKEGDLEAAQAQRASGGGGEEEDGIIPRRKPGAPSGPRPPPSADSSRALDCELGVFLGDDTIGKPVTAFGKAAVMIAGNRGTLPRFSKYSGVCEWRNCVFLWVNLGMSDYTNTFRGDGRYITWYGGSRMHEESDVVKRLVSAGGHKKDGAVVDDATDRGTGGGGGGDDVDDVVVLFVRLEGESYTCLGRLAHVSYALDKHPIEFEWELLDYDRMKNGDEFKRYLKF